MFSALIQRAIKTAKFNQNAIKSYKLSSVHMYFYLFGSAVSIQKVLKSSHSMQINFANAQSSVQM